MPFLDEDPTPDPRAPLGEIAQDKPVETPSFSATMGAAFRSSSTVGSALTWLGSQMYPYEPAPGYQPWDDIRGTRYELDHAESFAASRSRGETEAIKRRIDREIGDEQTLAAAGVPGLVAALGAGLVDPTIILPGGAIYRSVKGGVSIGRTALSVGTAGFAQGLASEAILQGTQETRTAEDLLIGVASSTILSGLLGGGAAALLSRAERRALDAALDQDRALLGGVDGMAAKSGSVDLSTNQQVLAPAANSNVEAGAAAVGAAASDTRTARPASYVLDSVPWLGTAVERVSPVLRTMQSDLGSARRAVVDLAETALATVDNALGIATTRGPSAEREIRMAQRQLLVGLNDVLDDAWKRHRFGAAENAPVGARLRDALSEMSGRAKAEKLTFSQFDEAVGQAMRRGDRHEVPEVAEVAQWVRANVFEPWKARAIAKGLLPENVEVKTAESYFTRSYSREKITARMSEFTRRTADWLEAEQTRKREIQARVDGLEERRRQLRSAAGRIEAKLARAQARLARIETRADERASELRRVDARADAVDARLADQEAELSDLAEAIAALRAQAQSPLLQEGIAQLERNLRALQRAERAERLTPKDLERIENEELDAGFLRDDLGKAIADMVLGRRKLPKEPSFVDYIVTGGEERRKPVKGIRQPSSGGVRDTGGDVRSLMGGKPSLRPGLINRHGRDLDEWGEKLLDDFPHAFGERPTAFEVETLLGEALAGRQPYWFVEARLSREELELLEASREVEALRAEMQAGGYALAHRRDVARFIRDNVAAEPAGPERFDEPGMPVPASVAAEDAGRALTNARATRDGLADAVARARQRRIAVERGAAGNAGRAAEIGIAGRAQTARLDALSRQAAVAEEKRALQEQALELIRAEQDYLFALIEADLKQWGGKSVSEALSAIKAREKADAARRAKALAEGLPEPTNRLAGADADILSAVRRILGSDRDMPRMELEERAREIAYRILSSPDGRLPYADAPDDGGGVPMGRNAPRHALAQREFMIPDEMIEDFLDDSTSHAVRKFLHATVPDIVLTERFGDFNLTEIMRKINDEAGGMMARAKSEAERRKIEAERKMVVKAIGGIRDRLRGTFALNGLTGSENAGRIGMAVRAYNMLADLGGAALSSVPDAFGAMMRWGLGTVLSDAYRPFVKGLMGQSEGYKKAKQQYRAMGIGVEMALATRSRALNDIAPDYRPQSRLERVLQAGAEASFVVNLLAPWTDFTKTIASVVSGNEIFRAAKAASEGRATKRQLADLAASGIDEQLARRIWAQFEGGGEVIDGVYLPNTGDWQDRGARLAFEGAVAREADIAVVTPGQEKPLWMSDPIVGLIGQHKSFMFAATERILLANLQRRDAQALVGLAWMISGGMMAAALYALASGKPLPERPQDWIKEGVNRSGALGWLEEVNTFSAKVTRGGLDWYRIIGADKPLSRYSSLTALQQALGPTAGKADAALRLAGAPFGEEGWSARDTANARRLLPFQNLFMIRRLLNEVEDSTNELFGIEPLERQ